jgi:hypothetical protein
MDEMSLLGGALKQSLEKGKNWSNKVKQGVRRTGHGGYLDNVRRE